MPPIEKSIQKAIRYSGAYAGPMTEEANGRSFESEMDWRRNAFSPVRDSEICQKELF